LLRTLIKTPLGEITLKQYQPFNFSVNAIDADGDKLSYTWTFEPGSEIVTGSNQVERIFTIPGEKKVYVVVSDGRSEVSQEWEVTVPEEVIPEVIAKPIPKTDALALEEPPKFKVYVIEH